MPAIERRIGWVGPQNKYWAWILERLPAVEYLSSCHDWRPETPDDLLLVAIDSRVASEWDEISEVIQAHGGLDSSVAGQSKKSRKKISSTASILSSKICLLLGESWAGHRRTQPIPESFHSFYWYELFDRLLPSLDSGIEAMDLQSPERGQRIVRWLSISEKLAQIDVSNQRVLVIADSSSAHEMWRESLEDRYASILGVDIEQLDRFRFQPDMVLIDFEAGPSTAEQHASEHYGLRVHEVLRRVRHRFPDSMTVVANGFPRWDDWEQWSLAGADVLFPKPGCLLGLDWNMKRWEQMQLAE